MNLLLAKNIVSSWSAYFNEFFKGDANTRILLSKTFGIISTILWVVLGIVGAIGAIYAIWLGVQLARAEDQGKRDDAKKHLITVFIAIGVTLALIVIFNVALPALISAFINPDALDVPENKPDKGMIHAIKPILSLLKA